MIPDAISFCSCFPSFIFSYSELLAGFSSFSFFTTVFELTVSESPRVSFLAYFLHCSIFKISAAVFFDRFALSDSPSFATAYLYYHTTFPLSRGLSAVLCFAQKLAQIISYTGYYYQTILAKRLFTLKIYKISTLLLRYIMIYLLCMS